MNWFINRYYKYRHVGVIIPPENGSPYLVAIDFMSHRVGAYVMTQGLNGFKNSTTEILEIDRPRQSHHPLYFPFCCTCVGAIKKLIHLTRKPWIITPHQLYNYYSRRV